MTIKLWCQINTIYVCAMHIGETFLYKTDGVSFSFPNNPRLNFHNIFGL